MGEKRSHIRYAVNADINLKTDDGDSYVLKSGVTNISFHGATVFSPEKLDLENKPVHFELASGLSSESLKGKGRVKYIIKEERKDGSPLYKMGLEFIDIDKSAIMHFVNRLQEMQSSKIKKTYRIKKEGVGYAGPF